MLANVDADTGQDLMRQWGVESWVDPCAEYAVYDQCCVFAVVNQGDFLDIHMAMDASRRRHCREAGKAILAEIGHHRLRAVILADRPRVCNYASKMGFSGAHLETVKLVDGSAASVFIMWREPGGNNGRSN